MRGRVQVVSIPAKKVLHYEQEQDGVVVLDNDAESDDSDNADANDNVVNNEDATADVAGGMITMIGMITMTIASVICHGILTLTMKTRTQTTKMRVRIMSWVTGATPNSNVNSTKGRGLNWKPRDTVKARDQWYEFKESHGGEKASKKQFVREVINAKTGWNHPKFAHFQLCRWLKKEDQYRESNKLQDRDCRSQGLE